MVERKFIVGRAIEKETEVQSLLDKGWKISEMKMCGKTTGDTTIAVYLERETATINKNSHLPIQQGLEY